MFIRGLAKGNRSARLGKFKRVGQKVVPDTLR